MLDNNPRGTICIEDIEMGMTRYIRKIITDRDIEPVSYTHLTLPTILLV